MNSKRSTSKLRIKKGIGLRWDRQILLFVMLCSFIFFCFNVNLVQKVTSSNSFKKYPVYREKTDQPIDIFIWKGDHSNDEALNWLMNSETKQTFHCPFECTFSTLQSSFRDADAVIFSWKGLNDPNWWLRKPMEFPQKQPGQLWINFNLQTPSQFLPLKLPNFMVHYDLNVSYAQTAKEGNVPISFFCLMDDVIENSPTTEKFAAVILDDCKSKTGRKAERFLKDIMNYISVDSFGKCVNNRDLPPSMRGSSLPSFRRSVQNMVQLFSHYKFVFVFEEDIATDYVSEKLWSVWLAGSVPVYFGAPNVQHNWEPLSNIPSLINVDEFASPSSLATYLNTISKDPSAYQQFHSWRDREWSDRFQKRTENCILSSHCRICNAVAHKLEKKAKLINTLEEELHSTNYALYFNGQDNYVDIGNYGEFNLGHTFTITAWIYMDSMGDFRIKDKNTAGKVDGFGFDVLKKENRGFLRLCVMHDCYLAMKPLLPGNWYHVAVVYITSEAARKMNIEAGFKFYVNGELDFYWEFPKTFISLVPPAKNDLPLTIGKAAIGDSYWHGMMDDLSIWSIPLPQQKIQELMFERIGGLESGLLAFWSFDEGQGEIVHDSGKNLRHGRIQGTNIHWVETKTKPLILNDSI